MKDIVEQCHVHAGGGHIREAAAVKGLHVAKAQAASFSKHELQRPRLYVESKNPPLRAHDSCRRQGESPRPAAEVQYGHPFADTRLDQNRARRPQQVAQANYPQLKAVAQRTVATKIDDPASAGVASRRLQSLTALSSSQPRNPDT